jgi:hypothetical protein
MKTEDGRRKTEDGSRFSTEVASVCGAVYIGMLLFLFLFLVLLSNPRLRHRITTYSILTNL